MCSRLIKILLAIPAGFIRTVICIVLNERIFNKYISKIIFSCVSCGKYFHEAISDIKHLVGTRK